jgi:thioredoxin reductase (NADPH)
MSTKPTSEGQARADSAEGGQITDHGTVAAMAETPDTYGAYPKLIDEQLASLAALGQQRPVQAEGPLFLEGDLECDFFAILDGKVAIVEGYRTPAERTISVHGRGRFLGELGLLTGEAAYYSDVAIEPGSVLAMPADLLRDLIARDAELGDLVLRAYLIRRSILIGLGVGMRIVGSRYSPDARRLREFAARNRLPAQWLDLEDDDGTERLLTQLGVTPAQTPIVILCGRQLLRNPTDAELAAAIGPPAPSLEQATCELLVAGAGPAGLSVAVYGASEGSETVVLDGTAAGGRRPGGGLPVQVRVGPDAHRPRAGSRGAYVPLPRGPA